MTILRLGKEGVVIPTGMKHKDIICLDCYKKEKDEVYGTSYYVSPMAKGFTEYSRSLTPEESKKVFQRVLSHGFEIYPNSFEFQYVLPDKDRSGGDNTNILYNAAVDMHSKSFSAHVKIRVHTELRFERASLPSFYYVPDTMYMVFVGSHNVPSANTGLGKGYYTGYIKANVSHQDTATIWYEGDSDIQYEMSGQYPVYLSSTPPYIDRYDPNLTAGWPTVNIASEEATNAVRESEEAGKRQRSQDAVTFAILAVSFAAAWAPIRELTDYYLKPRGRRSRFESLDSKDNKSGYGGKTTNDH